MSVTPELDETMQPRAFEEELTGAEEAPLAAEPAPDGDAEDEAVDEPADDEAQEQV